MQQIDEALRMLDTFGSVGATHFDLTINDIHGEKRAFRATQSLSQLKKSMPRLFPGAAERHHNIIVRPKSDKVQFVQLDDLDSAGLARVKQAAFLTLETSAGNRQAWIAVSGLSTNEEEIKDFARRLRKGAGADLAASGATRVAGITNYKTKYSPNFPTVRIEGTVPGRIISEEELEAMGLVANPNEAQSASFTAKAVQARSGTPRPRTEKVWPDYARSLAGAPPNRRGDGPDRSMADFNWCITAIDWGWSVEDIAAKLVDVSAKATERVRLKDTGYPAITAQNAAAAVE